MWFKVLIFINLALILVSLAAGAFFLSKDGGQSRRVLVSLTTRVGLSILLIVLLLIGFATGQIHPHGVNPNDIGALAKP